MLKLHRFTDPQAFHNRVSGFLLAREAENGLMLGIVNSIIEAGEFRDQPPYLACVEQDGAPVAVATRTPPHGLLIADTAHPDALDLIAADVYAVYGGLNRVQASRPLAGDFAARWSQHTGQAHEHDMALRLYRLTQVRPPQGVPGVMRRVTEVDHARLADWWYHFQQDCFGNGDREQADLAATRSLTGPPQVRGFYFWEVGGQPVSMAGYMGPTPSSLRIGGVYTPPQQRRRGYAGALVAALSQHILDMGKTMATLFTDLANPTSNHIYMEVGYVPVCDVDTYAFGP